MRGRTLPLSDDDYRDIQGLVRFGHGHLGAARFHLLTIADAAAARAWLSKAPVTTAVKGHRPDTALQVAFTYEGLQRLGGAPGALSQFPYEFKSDCRTSELVGSGRRREDSAVVGSGAALGSCRTCWAAYAVTLDRLANGKRR